MKLVSLVAASATLVASAPVTEFSKSDCYGFEATDRPAIDVVAHTEANEALGRDLPRPDGAVLADVDADPYTRCIENGGGDVVGVTSRLEFTLPARMTKCEVVEVVETGLRGDGWLVSPLETQFDDGWPRSTHAYRDRAAISFLIGPVADHYIMVIDHDSLEEPPDLVTDVPCT